MKNYILTLCVITSLSLPMHSTAIDKEITSLIVGSAGLASLVVNLFIQPDYTEMTKNATSQEELDKVNICAQHHADDIAMLKGEMKKYFEPLAYKIHKCSIEKPNNILGTRFPKGFFKNTLTRVLNIALEKTSTYEQNS